MSIAQMPTDLSALGTFPDNWYGLSLTGTTTYPQALYIKKGVPAVSSSTPIAPLAIDVTNGNVYIQESAAFSRIRGYTETLAALQSTFLANSLIGGLFFGAALSNTTAVTSSLSCLDWTGSTTYALGSGITASANGTINTNQTRGKITVTTAGDYLITANLSGGFSGTSDSHIELVKGTGTGAAAAITVPRFNAYNAALASAQLINGYLNTVVTLAASDWVTLALTQAQGGSLTFTPTAGSLWVQRLS